MDLLAFVLALQAEGKTSEEIRVAVNQYIEDNPSALNQAAVEAILDGRLDDIVLAQQNQPTSEDNRIWFPTTEGETVQVPTYAEHSELKSAIADMNTATSAAIGKALSPKTVTDGKVTEWQFKTIPSGGGGGGGAVDDVQVNGVSVVQDGVANFTYASVDNFGVTKISPGKGLYKTSDNGLGVYPATPAQVKVGTDNVFAITSQKSKDFTFYGLAKAAGDTTQSQSSNAIGTYTDAAKSAIQIMLGISGIIAPVEGATASKPYAIGDAFLHGGALYKASAAIAAGDAIVPETNCTQTTIIEMLKGV